MSHERGKTREETEEVDLAGPGCGYHVQCRGQPADPWVSSQGQVHAQSTHRRIGRASPDGGRDLVRWGRLLGSPFGVPRLATLNSGDPKRRGWSEAIETGYLCFLETAGLRLVVLTDPLIEQDGPLTTRPQRAGGRGRGPPIVTETPCGAQRPEPPGHDP